MNTMTYNTTDRGAAYAAYAAAAARTRADYWVNHCFEVTDEGKTTYINKLKSK